MNEQELGKEIAKLLDYSASDNIKQSTAYRLQSARRAALEHYQPALKIVGSGNGTSIFSGHDWHFNTGKLILLVMVFFAFVVGSTSYWKFLEKNRHDAGDDPILIDSFSIEDQNDTELEWKSDFPDDLQLNKTQDFIDESHPDSVTDHHTEMLHDPSSEVEINIKREIMDELPVDTQLDQKNDPVSNLSPEIHLDEVPENWLVESN